MTKGNGAPKDAARNSTPATDFTGSADAESILSAVNRLIDITVDLKNRVEVLERERVIRIEPAAADLVVRKLQGHKDPAEFGAGDDAIEAALRGLPDHQQVALGTWLYHSRIKAGRRRLPEFLNHLRNGHSLTGWTP
jgi:translation elongation factor EF-1alpha